MFKILKGKIYRRWQNNHIKNGKTEFWNDIYWFTDLKNIKNFFIIPGSTRGYIPKKK